MNETTPNVTVYDNGGRTFDGYALGIGDTGNVPNGFCMSLSPGEYVEGPHMGEIISLNEMTDAARRAVEGEIRFAQTHS